MTQAPDAADLGPLQVRAISVRAVTLLPMGEGHCWAPRSAPGGVCDAWMVTTETGEVTDRVVYSQYCTAREIGNERLRGCGRPERFPPAADDWAFAFDQGKLPDA